MKKCIFVPIVIILGSSMAFFYTRVMANLEITATNELIHVTIGDPTYLDPGMDYESYGMEIISQIYDPLLTFNREKTNEYIPMLATNWQISPGGDIYTFTIRQGVVFHNGNALTPEDVAYTFQRNLLLGTKYISPQWLFTEAFFGIGIFDICEMLDPSVCNDRSSLQEYQEYHEVEVAEVCYDVKNSISYDLENNRVVFQLAQAWNPLLSTLVGSWGSILDKEWSMDMGAWDGDCSTWQDYYYPIEDDPLASIANGTGPFRLDHWIEDTEIVLTRNPDYWRIEPMWEDSPFGPTMFEKFTRMIENDSELRADMLIQGDADFVLHDSDDYGRLYDQVLFAYDDTAGLIPTLIHPTGTLKLFRGGYEPTTHDLCFNYSIKEGGLIDYDGSGQLDGNGIPSDFFADEHVRKAFNYSFDWELYNNDLFKGSALQRTGPIVFGLDGYEPSQPVYYHSDSLALAEFSSAWEGELIEKGFKVILAYDAADQGSKRVVEILEKDIEALNEKFDILVVGLDPETYKEEFRSGHLPVFRARWIQDIAHPYNWIYPLLTGHYAELQSIPDDLKDKYQTMSENCLVLLGEEARECYETIQTTTYQDALDIFLVQWRTQDFLRAEVQGYYINPYPGGLLSYYLLTKSELPSVGEVVPESPTTIQMTSTSGTTLTAEVPIGAVESPISIVLTPDVPTYGNPTSFTLGDFSFDIQAFDGLGNLIDGLTLDQAMILTINYTDAQINVLDESSLMLFWWDGAAWVDAACGVYVRDLENNILEAPICHFSSFAIGGTTHEIFLPILVK